MRKRGAIFLGMWGVVVALLVASAIVIVGGRQAPPAARGEAETAPDALAERSPPAPPAVAAPPAPARAAQVPPAVAPPSEPPRPNPPSSNDAELLPRLRELVVTDPALAMQLAREANARTPDSPDAPERNWIVVKSLVNLQRFHEAHDEAQTMVNRYPGTSFSLDVQRHLLSNPLD